MGVLERRGRRPVYVCWGLNPALREEGGSAGLPVKLPLGTSWPQKARGLPASQLRGMGCVLGVEHRRWARDGHTEGCLAKAAP